MSLEEIICSSTVTPIYKVSQLNEVWSAFVSLNSTMLEFKGQYVTSVCKLKRMYRHEAHRPTLDILGSYFPRSNEVFPPSFAKMLRKKSEDIIQFVGVCGGGDQVLSLMSAIADKDDVLISCYLSDLNPLACLKSFLQMSLLDKHLTRRESLPKSVVESYRYIEKAFGFNPLETKSGLEIVIKEKDIFQTVTSPDISRNPSLIYLSNVYEVSVNGFNFTDGWEPYSKFISLLEYINKTYPTQTLILLTSPAIEEGDPYTGNVPTDVRRTSNIIVLEKVENSIVPTYAHSVIDGLSSKKVREFLEEDLSEKGFIKS